MNDEKIISGWKAIVLLFVIFVLADVLFEIPFILVWLFGYNLTNGIGYSIYFILVLFLFMKIFINDKGGYGK